MTTNLWGNNTTLFFFELSPDLILDTVEKIGLKTTGRVLTMNSMENRVYEVEIDSDSDNPSDHSVIIKFYRPGRWSREQIKEEHEFLLDLEEFEIPVVAPLSFNEETVFKLDNLDIYYALFPKKGGRAPDEFNFEEIEQVGRLLARLHNVGSMKKATHRLKISADTYVLSNLNYLVDQKILPGHQEQIYKSLLEQIYSLTKNAFNNVNFIRLHGDCHLGNILRRGDHFNMIDFDDMVSGPAIQDLWLLLPGRDDYAENLRSRFLEAYSSMRDFNFEELRLTEVLRTFRMINYSAWISKRYDDPAFKAAFSFFEQPTYWETQISDLREQVYLLENLSRPTYLYED